MLTRSGEEHDAEPQGWPNTVQPSEAEGGVGALGVDSPAGRAWARWPFVVPFAGRVLALQGMHPTVSAGLEDHSDVFDNTCGRAWETLRYGLELIFGDTERTAREIRALHREIRGVGYDGRRYHAWNPAAWTWVHLTTLEATLFSLDAIWGPVPADEQEALYADWKTVGLIYGVRESAMPGDVAGLRAHVARGIERDLVATPTARRLLDLVATRLPRPPGLPVPRPVWWLMQPGAGHAISTVLLGSFPAVLRRRLNVGWTPIHEAEYRGVLAGLRVTSAVLPDRLRLFPIAYQARKRGPAWCVQRRRRPGAECSG
jgi:uncharacterized protein (DUF2236 family)